MGAWGWDSCWGFQGSDRAACKPVPSAGVAVIADVVLNHMARPCHAAEAQTDGSTPCATCRAEASLGSGVEFTEQLQNAVSCREGSRDACDVLTIICHLLGSRERRSWTVDSLFIGAPMTKLRRHHRTPGRLEWHEVRQPPNSRHSLLAAPPPLHAPAASSTPPRMASGVIEVMTSSHRDDVEHLEAGCFFMPFMSNDKNRAAVASEPAPNNVNKHQGGLSPNLSWNQHACAM